MNQRGARHLCGVIVQVDSIAAGLARWSDWHDSYRGPTRGNDLRACKVGARLTEYDEAV